MNNYKESAYIIILTLILTILGTVSGYNYGRDKGREQALKELSEHNNWDLSDLLTDSYERYKELELRFKELDKKYKDKTNEL